MAMRYDTRLCVVTSEWEWNETTGSGGSKSVTKSDVPVTTQRDWIWFGGLWEVSGSVTLSSGQSSYSYSDSDGYSGSLSLQSWYEYSSPSTPSGSGTRDYERTTTYGTGIATYSGTVTQTKTYAWNRGRTYNNASSSISYDDGTYAGTLYLDSVSGTPSTPSFSGSYNGQTAETTTTGTAYYSGDVGLKETTPSGVGTISVTPSETSLIISWNTASRADKYALEVREGNSAGAIVYNAYNLSTTSATVSSLKANTTYHIKAYAINTYGNGSPSETTAVTKVTSRPSNWEWSTLTPTAITYSNIKLRANLLTSKDWNDFTARVNDFRKHKGLATITFTTAASSSDFTSTMYNQAKLAIDAMKVSTNPNGFYSKLVSLREALNSI